LIANSIEIRKPIIAAADASPGSAAVVDAAGAPFYQRRLSAELTTAVKAITPVLVAAEVAGVKADREMLEGSPKRRIAEFPYERNAQVIVVVAPSGERRGRIVGLAPARVVRCAATPGRSAAHHDGRGSTASLRRIASAGGRRRALRAGRAGDDEHRAIGPVDDRSRDRAEQRAGNGAESARPDHDQRSVPGASEVDDLIGRIPLEDLGVRFTPLLVDQRLRAVEGGSCVGHLLAELLLVVRLAQRPNRAPHVDEDRLRPERAGHPRSGNHRLFGRRGAVRSDDDRFCAVSVSYQGS
jgi:hypothetical protein